ncbi:hypothetical protein MPSEU_000498400 [Mayamaea pseudoterrestris]|nr:hypothetical protein MPSEU_000498400 [Mayamaea pseudoterrestris]
MSVKHFDVSQLPSLEHMTAKEEAQRRMKTVRFIEETCRLLRLPRVATATATVFFHRFYAKHSFETHDRFEVAVAAILLAAKTEESPKKLNVVIEEAYKLKTRNIQTGRLSQAATDASPEPASAVHPATTAALDPKSDEFSKLRERVLLLERVILHTIGFELSVTHPYKYILEFSQRAITKKQVEFVNPEETRGVSTSQAQVQLTNKVVQIAMNFANDSFQTSLCLQAAPDQIAIACMYLAFEFAGTRPTQMKTWLEVLGYPEVEQLISICCQIMDLISERKGSDEAMFSKIKATLEKMKDEVVISADEPAAKKIKAA